MRTAHSSSRGGSAPPRVWAWRPSPPGCGAGDPPWVWAWRHPSGCGPGDHTHTHLGVGLETPQPDPSTSPLGVGLETCKACWDTPPQTCKACWDTTPPTPPDRILDTRFWKYYLAPNFVCGGKNWRTKWLLAPGRISLTAFLTHHENCDIRHSSTGTLPYAVSLFLKVYTKEFAVQIHKMRRWGKNYGQ